mmetsp:Transcript_45357/g.84590  ORF Transcript_45357/g.84590 Transcript_45357/m.84590 type:complete len:208 (-) Transcript_45357:205-828(-)
MARQVQLCRECTHQRSRRQLRSCSLCSHLRFLLLRDHRSQGRFHHSAADDSRGLLELDGRQEAEPRHFLLGADGRGRSWRPRVLCWACGGHLGRPHVHGSSDSHRTELACPRREHEKVSEGRHAHCGNPDCLFCRALRSVVGRRAPVESRPCWSCRRGRPLSGAFADARTDACAAFLRVLWQHRDHAPLQRGNEAPEGLRCLAHCGL